MNIENYDEAYLVVKNLPISDDGKYIFYILENGLKIFVKYSEKPHFYILKKSIINKIIKIQCFFSEGGEKKKIELGEICYNDIKVTRGFVNFEYSTIISKGYKSFDGKKTFDLNKLDWKLGPDHNFNFNIHALRFLSSFWGEYLKTFNILYIKRALHIFIDFWKSINSLKIDKFKRYDMAVGIRALHLYFLSHFKEHFSQEESQIFEQIFDFHLEELSKPNVITQNNHGIWQVYGLRLLILARGDKNTLLLNQCNVELKKLLDFSFNEEGIHVENSPFYHNYVVDLFNFLPKSLFSLNKLNGVLKDKSEFLFWFTDKNHQYFQIGDSHGGVNKTYSLQNLHADFNINGVDFYSKIYKKSGYLVIKSNNANDALIVSCTNDSLVHKHADNMSFILWHKGVELITDSGLYAYTYDEYRDYFISDKAHNVLSLKGKVLTPKDICPHKSFLEDFFIGNEFYTLRGKSSYNGFEYLRDFEYKPTKEISIKDTILENVFDLDYSFILNFPPTVDIVHENGLVLLLLNNKIFGTIKCDTVYKEILVYKGNKKPIRGWVSKKYNNLEPSCSIEYVFNHDTPEILVDIKLI
ncbi:heparinase II/III family protein [Acinetobacter thermotolerans]|uniref:heparinase II/III domain-containing protein n=1 Tax=Acinetobacter thermotolerans TaxID=3151487 RepID=UPI00325A558C